MSDSDSSEDEANDQLLAAVDSTFLCEKLYKTPAAVGETKKKDEGVTATTVPCAAAKQPAAKSNRYLLEEDSIFHSDLNVTATVQKHIAEKLSTLISSVVEFDNSTVNQHSTQLDDSITDTGVQLLKGFTEVIDLNTEPEVRVNLKPTPIIRRKIDCESETARTDRIASSICDPSTFPKEIQSWKGPRKRSIVYQYKKKPDGTLLETPDLHKNEFTKARNANHWNECKIRNFKRQK
uniref:Uncharacterized protein n=1 Tax=Anopheles minimus TaxID=112268 RepID=A0A182W083_9DIPT